MTEVEPQRPEAGGSTTEPIAQIGPAVVRRRRRACVATRDCGACVGRRVRLRAPVEERDRGYCEPRRGGAFAQRGGSRMDRLRSYSLVGIESSRRGLHHEAGILKCA